MKTKFKDTKIGEIPKDSKSLNEKIGFLLKILENVRKKTEDDQKEKVYVWTEHYLNWIDIWKYFNKHIEKENFINSCFEFRLTQLNKELLWFWLECTSGIYDNAVRDSRYILESFLQAYYVDREHPHASMECKLEILKEIDKLAGRRLIERLDITGKYKEQIKKLYSELCKWVHPSYEEWKEIVKEGKIKDKITFSYDKELFEKCMGFTDRVIDTIVFLLMNFCNDLIEKIRDNKTFLKSINNVKNSLVIQYIQEVGKKNETKIKI